jgi:hypothetical protein
MTKFDQLFEALINEVDWKGLAGSALSTAGKTVGSVGYGLGTGGKSIPGTSQLAGGLQSLGQKISAPSYTTSKTGTTIPKTTTPISPTGNIVIDLRGLKIPASKPTTPKPYKGGMLWDIKTTKNTRVGNQPVGSVKILTTGDKAGAAKLSYFDDAGMPIQNIGMPKVGYVKQSTDDRGIQTTTVSDKPATQPVAFNRNDKTIQPGASFKAGSTFTVMQNNQPKQYKVSSIPDVKGDFTAEKV